MEKGICTLKISELCNIKHKNILTMIHGRGNRKGFNNILRENMEEYFIKSNYKDKQDKIWPCYLATKKGCELLLTKRSINKKAFIDYMKEYFNENNITYFEITRKEVEFIKELEDALEPFGIKGKKQYHILRYRIDYYIPNLNIAIEYDENDHSNYSYEAHEGRQQEIERELGCRFIRVSDKNSDAYNIGLVIKNIFNL